MTSSDEGRRIVAFYEGSAPDDRGRFLDAILDYDDDRIEAVHDFIQWLFPLPERSGANPCAPILDDAAIEAFHARPELRAALRRSLDRMLAFYGFERNGERVTKSASYARRSRKWLQIGNHNHLRLTRMLRSLYLLGEARAAQALFERLTEIYRDERQSPRSRISERTFEFWRAAIGG
jgi:hypothetical protein